MGTLLEKINEKEFIRKVETEPSWKAVSRKTTKMGTLLEKRNCALAAQGARR